MNAEMILNTGLILGEGPVWDDEKGYLYWVDIESRLLYRWDLKSEKAECHQFNQRISMVCLTKKRGVIVALEDGVYEVNPVGVNLIASNPETIPGSRFNDGKCDVKGRLWLGTLDMNGNMKQSSLYRFSPEGSCSKILEGVSISNGLAFSPDGRYMYYIDTPTKVLWRFDFDCEAGEITNRTAFIDYSKEKGLFDGMTIDTDGNLWVCHWGGAQVSKWNGNTGKKLDVIMLPTPNVTCCVFGGSSGNRLFITTAEEGVQPGALYCCDTDVKGIPCARFG